MGKTQVEVRLRYNTHVKVKHNSCQTAQFQPVFDVATPQSSKFLDVLKKHYRTILHVFPFPTVPNSFSLYSVFYLLLGATYIFILTKCTIMRHCT